MITSPSNPRIRALQRLGKRREREATGLFLIEGARELERALDAGVVVETVVHAGPTPLAARAAESLTVSERVLESLVYRGSGAEVVGVARTFDATLDRIAVAGDALLLVAQGIEKPGNLGAMLRSAAAAGATGLIVADAVVDLFNPNVVRASLGALFTVPVATGTAETIVPWLRERGVHIFATAPDAAIPYWDAPLRGAAAVVVGSEHAGLPPAWLDAADERIVVPMPGTAGVDSLNAASTAAIVLFDAVRQRAAGPADAGPAG